MQQARTFQKSAEFQPYRQMRLVAEHRLARLVQLGIRHARYFGRRKTLFQLLMAATLANLTFVATKTGQMKSKTDGEYSFLFDLGCFCSDCASFFLPGDYIFGLLFSKTGFSAELL
jgi:hypothetical protein